MISILVPVLIPIFLLYSKVITFKPYFNAVSAATEPDAPAPITRTSHFKIFHPFLEKRLSDNINK